MGEQNQFQWLILIILILTSFAPVSEKLSDLVKMLGPQLVFVNFPVIQNIVYYIMICQ